MIAVVLSFFAAVKAGDLWARATVVGLIFATVLGVIGWQIHRIKSEAAEAERSRIERINQEKADAAKRELDRVIGGDTSRVRGFDRD